MCQQMDFKSESKLEEVAFVAEKVWLLNLVRLGLELRFFVACKPVQIWANYLTSENH